NTPVEHEPAMAPPTRTNDQILPRIRWVPIRKSNCYLDVERSQSNPIYKITDTVRYDNKTGSYNCQLDEQWFNLTKDTLRDALQITLVETNNAFSSPPTPDAVIKFVNDLGYPRVVRTLSDVVTNNMFQPWRALTTVINLCLTGKTSGFERPRALVLQILWGIVNRAHIDYAERIKHKFHPRPCSPLHLLNEELVRGYLKFSAKGTKREFFGMPIPNDLIIDDIREVSDPDSHAPKLAKATKPKATKQSKPLAPKAAPATKPAAAKAHNPLLLNHPRKTKVKSVNWSRSLLRHHLQPNNLKLSKVIKKRTQKSSLQLVDEFVDKGVLVNDPRFGDEEADLQKAVEESLKEFTLHIKIHSYQ
ncbi:monodehydroascorbate reductase, partial [Tanacetum coccineum]